MTRAFLIDCVRPAAWTWLVGSGLAAIVAATRLLWGDSGMLDVTTWAVLVMCAIPASWSVVLPASGAVAVVTTLGRWVEEGAWLGWRATGGRGRALVPAVFIVGGCVGLATGVMTLSLEPWLLRQARSVLIGAVAEVELSPGSMVEMGGVAIRPARRVGSMYEDVFWASDRVRGQADRMGFRQHGDGLSLEVERGRMLGTSPHPWKLEFEHWTRPLERMEGPRLELNQRSYGEMKSLIEKTREAGRDASYEEAVLLKRFTLPLAFSLVPFALLPLGRMRWRGMGLMSAGLAMLIVIRLGDFGSVWLGSVGSAFASVGFVGAVAAVSWLGWGSR